jgi:predicted metal-dependent phosphoesterase TrpH
MTTMPTFKFDLHVHTDASDSIVSPEEALLLAKQAGMDGIAITDHDTMEGYEEAKKFAKKIGIILIPAVEITTALGDILAYGVTKMPEGTIVEIFDKIHAEGGAAAIAHPYASFRQINFHEIIDTIKHNIDAIEIYNAMTPLEDNVKAMELAKKTGLPGIGGSDAHFPDAVGTAFTVTNIENVIEAIKKGQTKVGWI